MEEQLIEVEGSIKVSEGINGIRYHMLEGQKDIRLCLRGQPSPGSNMGVCRIYLENDRWIVNGDYINDGVVKWKSIWRCQIEGRVENVKALCLYSTSEGWLTIGIDNNEFVEGDWAVMDTYSRAMYPTVELDVPNDITDVYVQQ